MLRYVLTYPRISTLKITIRFWTVCNVLILLARQFIIIFSTNTGFGFIDSSYIATASMCLKWKQSIWNPIFHSRTPNARNIRRSIFYNDLCQLWLVQSILRTALTLFEKGPRMNITRHTISHNVVKDGDANPRCYPFKTYFMCALFCKEGNQSS